LFMNTESKGYQKVIYSIFLAFCLLWVTAIIIAPLWHDGPGAGGTISEYTYSFFSKSCHQIDDRSFHMWGNKLGVCSRCTAIYIAFLLGVIIYPFVRNLSNIDLPSLIFLGVGVLLLVLDAGLDIFDVVKNTFVTREITGAIIGFVLPFYLIPGTIRVFYEFKQPPVIIPKK